MHDQDQGPMSSFEKEAHSFVIRIWRENRSESGQAGEWRGWIDHVQSGRRRYFRDTGQLGDEIGTIIGDYLGQSPASAEDSQPASGKSTLS